MSGLGGVRIAHVTTIAESLKMLLLNQLRALQSHGLDVTGISGQGEGGAELEAAGIRHMLVPFRRATNLTPLADARVTLHLANLFRRERFTIVHTHTAKPDLYAAIAARLAGVPIVVSTLHGFYFHDLMPKRTRAMYIRLARIGMRFCDIVLSQNEEDVATAMRESICPPSKIEVLGNGIDVVRFDRTRVSAASLAKLRHELGIADDAPVIGYVGRLVAEKGVLELLEAARAIRERHPRARLLLIGMIDEAKQDAIRPETAARYGVADTCVFAGHRDDMPELYALMDVCVLASHREGFPRTLMEASAMSIPTVATSIRGCRSCIEHGRNGLLVPLRDVGALAGAISSLLDDRARCEAMAAEGRKIALARFDERNVFEKVLATYERLLARST
ncbi:MAG TPA: glycosyltransferase family 4 protein [Kofleriaceae bacterium]|nr:glycosyltransferase family 4 protein [Kofleriaceae bacterium]